MAFSVPHFGSETHEMTTMEIMNRSFLPTDGIMESVSVATRLWRSVRGFGCGLCRKHYTKEGCVHWLFITLTAGCCFAVAFCLICCFIGLFIAIQVTERNDNLWAEDMTDCGRTSYCGAGQGPLLTPGNMTRYIAYAGCRKGWKSDEDFDRCGADCFSSKLPAAMEQFNEKMPYFLVSFPSRAGPAGQEVVNITAWVLPANTTGLPPSELLAPRVVVQHGDNSNFNSRKVQTMGYYMRSMGFSVIIPNLRGHGTSGSSTTSHKTTWGWEYPYDLLAAWDYAVNDTEALFGGRVPPERVGCLGESMGAFVCSTAFGMEPQMGGAWVDSGVFDPYMVLYSVPVIAGMGFSGSPNSVAVFASFLAKFTRFWDWRLCGVDLAFNTPMKTWPTANTTGHRRVMVVHSYLDNFVPIEESFDLMALAGVLLDKYTLDGVILPPSKCNGDFHTETFIAYAERYRSEMCRFWSGVFNRSVALCRLHHLPPL